MSNTTVQVPCSEVIASFLQCVMPKYKTYKALLTQNGTEAPTAVVLENTLGVDITWSRLSNGLYRATPSSPIFDLNKTFHLVNHNNQGYQFEVMSQLNDVDDWRIQSIDSGQPSDSSIENLPIEIQVYN